MAAASHDIRRLERGLLAAAVVVDRHGPAFTPIFERLERELAATRGPRERAALLLERAAAARPAAQIKAIASA